MDNSESRLVYEFGDFHLDATRRSLLSKADGRVLPLTSKAFETLLYLVEHRGELLDKATLMRAIWPNTVVEENNLNQSITTLRRVLGESPGEHRFIVTVPGRGYPVRGGRQDSDRSFRATCGIEQHRSSCAIAAARCG